MPSFSDWTNFGGFMVQASFGWMYYNREGFTKNVSMRQKQMYQQKNYQISWVAVSRADIRGMMAVTINRLNNFMIVGALILSVAAGTFFAAAINPEAPSYVIYAYWLTVATALVFLVLAISLAVKGQNSAIANTMKLLTFQMMPEAPADYTHDYMQQAQWIERVGGVFGAGMTGLGNQGLFRIPGIRPDYGTSTAHQHKEFLQNKMEAVVDDKKVRIASCSGATTADSGISSNSSTKYASPSTASFADAAGAGAARTATGNKAAARLLKHPEDATPLEELFVDPEHTWYLLKYGQFQRIWLPYEKYSRYCMGSGIFAILQALAYHSLGEAWRGDAFATVQQLIVTFVILYMVFVVSFENTRQQPSVLRLLVVAGLLGGPLLSALAAALQYPIASTVFSFFIYAGHMVYWAGAWRSLGRLKDEKLKALATKDQGFWAAERRVTHEARTASLVGKPPRERTAEPVERAAGRAAEEDEMASLKRQAIKAEMGYPTSRYWPTDQPDFHDQLARRELNIRSVVKRVLALAFLSWFGMFVFLFVVTIADAVAAEDGDVEGTSSPSELEAVDAAWPIAFFQPRALACGRPGQVFVTDGYQVFELSLAGHNATQVPCAVDAPIVDLSAACPWESPSVACTPVALLRNGRRGSSSELVVVDCASSQRWRLVGGGGGACSGPPAGDGAATCASDAEPPVSAAAAASTAGRSGGHPQADELPERFAVLPRPAAAAGRALDLTEHELLLARAGEVWRYSFSDGQFLPRWDSGAIDFLGAAAAYPLRGLSASFDRLVFLGGAAAASPGGRRPPGPAVQVRDRSSMEVQGHWVLPTTDRFGLTAGCAEDAGLTALLAYAPGAGALGEQPRLRRIVL